MLICVGYQIDTFKDVLIGMYVLKVQVKSAVEGSRHHVLV